MKTLVKNEFRQTRKTLLIWLGIMLLLCGFCYFELLSLKDSLDEMARTVGQFPRLIMIMFGVKGDLTTALGWYACIYFWEGLLGVSIFGRGCWPLPMQSLWACPVWRGKRNLEHPNICSQSLWSEKP